MRPTRVIAIAMIAVAGVAACGDGRTVQPNEPNVRVFLSAAPLQVGAAPGVENVTRTHGVSQMLDVVGMGGIPVEAVDSINAQLIGIAGIEPGDSVAYAWPLTLVGPALRPMNLRALPATGVDSIEIARGVIPTGTYTSMRLRFSSATITFNRSIVSRGVTFEAGTHPLDMTHGITYAADVPGGTIVLGETPLRLTITYDIASSVAGITNSDSTHLNMNPIFRRN